MPDAKRENASSLLYVDPYTLDQLNARMEAGWEEVAKLAETRCEEQGTRRSSFGLEGLNDAASFDDKAEFGRQNKAWLEKELGEPLEFSSAGNVSFGRRQPFMRLL